MAYVRTVLTLSIILFLGAQSCGFYHEHDPGQASSIVPGTVTWGQVYTQVFQRRCDLCHSVGGAGFNSSNYASVVAEISKVESHCLGAKKNMPADSPLTDYEATLLQDWINEGTPDTGGGP